MEMEPMAYTMFWDSEIKEAHSKDTWMMSNGNYKMLTIYYFIWGPHWAVVMPYHYFFRDAERLKMLKKMATVDQNVSLDFVIILCTLLRCLCRWSNNVYITGIYFRFDAHCSASEINFMHASI